MAHDYIRPFLPVSGIVRIQFERPQEIRDEAAQRFIDRLDRVRLRDRAAGTVFEPSTDAEPLDAARELLWRVLPETDDAELIRRQIDDLVATVIWAHEEAVAAGCYPIPVRETVTDYGRIMLEAAKRLARIPPEVRHEIGLPQSPENLRSLSDRCESWVAAAVPAPPPHRPANGVRQSLDQAAIRTFVVIEGARPVPYAARVRRLAHLLYFLAGLDDSEEAVKQSVAGEAKAINKLMGLGSPRGSSSS